MQAYACVYDRHGNFLIATKNEVAYFFHGESGGSVYPKGIRIKNGPGARALPGGKADDGESVANAAAREWLEETGTAVDPASAVAHEFIDGKTPYAAAYFEVTNIGRRLELVQDAVVCAAEAARAIKDGTITSWGAFRHAYPDSPVDNELSTIELWDLVTDDERINALKDSRNTDWYYHILTHLKTILKTAATQQEHNMQTMTHAQSDKIAEAKRYFISLQAKGNPEPPNPNIEDSDGLVSYVFPVANNPPPALMDDIKTLGGKLQALVGIVTAAVLKTTEADPSKLHDFKTWYTPFAKMGEAWFAQFKDTEKTMDKTVKGVEVATQVIQILLDAAVNEGAAMADFAAFLKSQGDTMKLESTSEGQGYRYAALCIAHEVFQLPDGSWVYVPKLRCLWTEFTRETFQITSGCAKFDQFRMNFRAQELLGVFNYQMWKDDPQYRQQLDDFIHGLNQAKIDESKNYFEGVFSSSSTSAAGA